MGEPGHHQAPGVDLGGAAGADPGVPDLRLQPRQGRRRPRRGARPRSSPTPPWGRRPTGWTPTSPGRTSGRTRRPRTAPAGTCRAQEPGQLLPGAPGPGGAARRTSPGPGRCGSGPGPPPAPGPSSGCPRTLVPRPRTPPPAASATPRARRRRGTPARAAPPRPPPAPITPARPARPGSVRRPGGCPCPNRFRICCSLTVPDGAERLQTRGPSTGPVTRPSRRSSRRGRCSRVRWNPTAATCRVRYVYPSPAVSLCSVITTLRLPAVTVSLP